MKRRAADLATRGPAGGGEAIADLRAIVEFIARDSAEAAGDVGHELTAF